MSHLIRQSRIFCNKFLSLLTFWDNSIESFIKRYIILKIGTWLSLTAIFFQFLTLLIILSNFFQSLKLFDLTIMMQSLMNSNRIFIGINFLRKFFWLILYFYPLIFLYLFVFLLQLIILALLLTTRRRIVHSLAHFIDIDFFLFLPYNTILLHRIRL